MFVSTMMTGHDDGNHADGPLEMATWDVSRAPFCGEARRWIYTRLLEGHEQKGKVARLCRGMYGMRDAASIWGDTWAEVLKESSMKVGTACPALFCSHDGDLKGLCHGDDFCVVARRKQLQIFGERPSELKRLGRYLVKNKRCVLTYARQTSDETFQVHVDSDWAGDLLGRKSTTGVIVRRGTHILRHMSCLQTLVALLRF